MDTIFVPVKTLMGRPGQRSEVGSQKSEVRGKESATSNNQPKTRNP